MVSYPRGEYSLIWAIRGRPAGQGMAFWCGCLSRDRRSCKKCIMFQKSLAVITFRFHVWFTISIDMQGFCSSKVH